MVSYQIVRKIHYYRRYIKRWRWMMSLQKRGGFVILMKEFLYIDSYKQILCDDRLFLSTRSFGKQETEFL